MLRRFPEPALLIVRAANPTSLAFVVGEILIVRIPLGDACRSVRQVCIPTDEVDGIVEIISIRRLSTRVILVPGPGAVERLRVPVRVGSSLPGYEAQQFCTWWFRVESERRLLPDYRHLYVGWSTPALFRLFRRRVPIAPVLEDRTNVVEILRHPVFSNRVHGDQERANRQVGQPYATWPGLAGSS